MHSRRFSGALEPLNGALFRSMWIAMFVSNMGTWMHDLASGWLMTSLTDSALLVALVQTAVSLPFFIVAFPAGVLADIIDRRRYLMVMMAWMLVTALLLGAVTLAGLATPWLVIALTFALGTGNAMMRPAWSASIPDFAPREQLRNAVTLNSMSMNASRAIGPALAGVLIAWAGPGPVFMLNGLSFIMLIVAVYRWQPPQLESNSLPVERFFEAFTAGLRYARHSPEVRRVLLRCTVFFTFGSAIWALLPLVAQRLLASGPLMYAWLMANIGVGAVVAAIYQDHLYRRTSRNRAVTIGSCGVAIALLAMAWVRNPLLLALLLMLGGAGWILVFSAFVVAAQLAVPNWVRARALSLVMLVMGGASAGGAALWGRIADSVDLPSAIAAAGLGLLLTLPIAARFALRDDSNVDLTPSIYWPPPILDARIEPDHGPVLVTLRYDVPPARMAEFLALLAESRRIRRRDGAFFWETFADISKPDRHVEIFMVNSWLEHLRQHQRVTVADRLVLDKLKQFHASNVESVVSHYIASHNRPQPLMPSE